MNIAPPKAAAKTVSLLSNNGILAGVPYGTVPTPVAPPPPPTPPALGGPGAWTFTAKGSDVQNIATTLQKQVVIGGTTFYRIDPAVLDDIYVICHFSTN